MSNFIVTTSINNVTKAIKLYDNMKNWKLIVVGDLKHQKTISLKMEFIYLQMIKLK